MFLATLGVSMLRNMLTGKEWQPKKYVSRAGEGVVWRERGYNYLDHMNKNFTSSPSLNQIANLKLLNISIMNVGLVVPFTRELA